MELPREWEVEVTGDFEAWWNDLSEGEQENVDAKVMLLRRLEPKLGRPHADTVGRSRHRNMKELVVQHQGRPFRGFLRSIHAARLSCSSAEIRRGIGGSTSDIFPSRTGSTTST